MTIPSRAIGTLTTVTSSSLGTIEAKTGWNPPLILGGFDIIIDVDNNGIYNQRVDALDDSDIEVTAGFFVIPEFALGTIMSLTIFFAAFAVFRKSRARTQNHV